MNKVLVEVFVPSINESYDIFIPLESPLYEVIALIKKAINEMSENRFIGDEHTTIFNKNDGTILNINLSIYELEIKNGTKLMLI